MVTSGHADKHCIFVTADTSMFKILLLYYTMLNYTIHTTAINVIQRDVKAYQQRQQQPKSVHITWLPAMWVHI